MTQFENKPYDLEERTTGFSKELISFLRKCPKNTLTIPPIDQCLRAGTSIGANYREANGASSKKDFQNKIYICKKEAKETLYWLELLGYSLDDESLKTECRKLWQETKEFVLIFGKIAANTR
jgi:four helix bundle protein